MIIRNDHLMRAVAQLSDTYLRAAEQLYRTDDEHGTLRVIEDALAHTLGTRPELLAVVSPASIAEFELVMQAQIGRMLTLRAQLLNDLGQHEWAAGSARLARPALLAALHVRLEDAHRSTADHVLRLLRMPLAATAFAPHEISLTYLQLFEHHALEQEFARAEDALFHALDLATEPGGIIARGIAFYEELLEMPASVLEAGALPREEVWQSLRDLRGYG